jgi:stearoyl-CoA desaturase (delta-9 desaturase)
VLHTAPSAAAQPRPRLSSDRARLSFQVTLALVIAAPCVAVLFAIWQLWGHGVGWLEVALLIGTYIPISLGVTVGFHRLLTHKSFSAHPIVKLLLLICGSMAIQGNCIGWAADHLLHHQLSDQEGDPHSPTEGLWHAHIGWMFAGRRADPAFYCPSLARDPIIAFVDRTFLLWVVLSLLIPFAIAGWPGLIWGGLVRVFFVHHVTWSVNSVCHAWGKRPYLTNDRSHNNWLVGVLGMGEGYHNNHHRWPRAAIHGMDRFQLDVSAWLIQALEKLHLATDVHRIGWETRQRARTADRGSRPRGGTDAAQHVLNVPVPAAR